MRKSFAKHLISLLLFGSNGIVASHIGLSSYKIVLLRTFFGSLLLLLFIVVKNNKISFKENKKDLLFISVSGIAMGTSWMFLYEAFSQIGVSIATLLYSAGPVIVMALSPLLFKEHLSGAKITGFICVLTGILLLNGNIFGASGNAFGFFCGIMSAVTYCIMVVSNKKSEHITGLENSLIQLIVSFFTVLIFVGFKSGFLVRISPSDWVWVLILGFINTGIGCYFYFSSIGNLPVQTVAVCSYIEPLSAVIFSTIFLKERMLPLQIIGAVLIIGGALFAECYKNSENRIKITP